MSQAQYATGEKIMPVGRDTQEPDLANPSPGTRRKKSGKRNSMTIDQMRDEKKLRDPGGMGIGIGPHITAYSSGIKR